VVEGRNRRVYGHPPPLPKLARYGKERRDDEPPKALRFKQKRLRSIRDAKEQSEKRTREKAIQTNKANAGDVPDKTSADSGYFSGENIQYLEGQGIHAYFLPGRDKKIQDTPPRGPIPTDLSKKDHMRRKLRTKKNRRATPNVRALSSWSSGRRSSRGVCASSCCEGLRTWISNGTCDVWATTF